MGIIPRPPPFQDMTGRRGNGLVDRHRPPPGGVIERRAPGSKKKNSTLGTETLSAAVGTGLAPADAQGAADECLGFANGTPARRPLPCFRSRSSLRWSRL